MHRISALLIVTLLFPAAALAQNDGRPPSLGLTGTWQASTPDGPQSVIVREDSTASFGEETVPWRVSADTIFIQFGEEWVGYTFALEADTLTLSGGDLEEPIELHRVGPAPKATSPARFRQ